MPAPVTSLAKTLFLTRLEAERAKLGLSQVAMAISLGVKPGRYQNWELRGSRPQDELTRMKLEHRFRLSLGELFSPAMVVEGKIQSMPNTEA